LLGARQADRAETGDVGWHGAGFPLPALGLGDEVDLETQRLGRARFAEWAGFELFRRGLRFGLFANEVRRVVEFHRYALKRIR